MATGVAPDWAPGDAKRTPRVFVRRTGGGGARTEPSLPPLLPELPHFLRLLLLKRDLLLCNNGNLFLFLVQCCYLS
jgi:hypothetical protein